MARAKRPVVAIISVVTLLALCITAIVAATRPSFEVSVAKSALNGHPAPPIVGETIGGTHFDLATYKGHWVYVNFFAGWCVPCQVETPELIAFSFEQSQRPDGAKLVSVLYNDSVSSAKTNIIDPYGLRSPAVIDPGGAIANAYGVTAPPSTFLIDPTGRVVANVVGQTTDKALTGLLDSARAATT